MSLETKLRELHAVIAADVKRLTTDLGAKTALNTTAKTSLVAAINELQAALATAGIDDDAPSTSTSAGYSAAKITALIAAVKNDLLNGAGSTLDTLKELGDAIGNDASFAANIATQIANRVRFDAAQTLTTGQQAQACANIGVGNPETDFRAAYIATRDA